MIDYSTPPAVPAMTTSSSHLGFAAISGYPSTVAGFIDARFAGPDITSLHLGRDTAIYATDSGRITNSGMTLDEWLKFDARARLLQQVELAAARARISLNAFEGLNVLVWLVERGVSHEQEEAIARSLPTVVAMYRELVRHIAEQAEVTDRSRH